MTDRRVISQRRRLRPTAVAVTAAAGAALLLATPAHAATSGTGSTQTVTFTPNAQLSIAASPASLGALTATSGALAIPLGSVVVTDTEADSTDWSASVASSNCFLPATLPTNLTGVNTATATIPASALTLQPGKGPVAPTTSLDTSGTPAPALLSTGGAFADPSSTGSLGSLTFGASQSLAYTSVYPPGNTNSDTLANDGTYTLSPSVSLQTSGNGYLAVPASYTCTLQYTITG